MLILVLRARQTDQLVERDARHSAGLSRSDYRYRISDVGKQCNLKDNVLLEQEKVETLMVKAKNFKLCIRAVLRQKPSHRILENNAAERIGSTVVFNGKQHRLETLFMGCSNEGSCAHILEDDKLCLRILKDDALVRVSS
ncbi:hypothetical protein EVAR_69021_1 [Eumeta japonica]|uniref:Uncharacterized protein n=1 Tax=Eumeta variegata TaxID=151549 RepID=A0A4C2A796_EUMVA|nr:hypothetical protein EVAR_69021_1 [Eumeta japonica]